MKTEITLQRKAIENLIDLYDRIVNQLNISDIREYYIGMRDAYKNLIILFSDEQDLSDLYSEAFTPPDES